MAVPLDLDSSPWRRWSPVLLDVLAAAFLIHAEIALLHAFFPTAADAATSASGVILFFTWLAPPALLQLWWWGRAAALMFLLLSVRAAIGVAGWHRLSFFPIILLAPAIAHLHWLDFVLSKITA